MNIEPLSTPSSHVLRTSNDILTNIKPLRLWSSLTSSQSVLNSCWVWLMTYSTTQRSNETTLWFTTPNFQFKHCSKKYINCLRSKPKAKDYNSAIKYITRTVKRSTTSSSTLIENAWSRSYSTCYRTHWSSLMMASYDSLAYQSKTNLSSKSVIRVSGSHRKCKSICSKNSGSVSRTLIETNKAQDLDLQYARSSLKH